MNQEMEETEAVTGGDKENHVSATDSTTQKQESVYEYVKVLVTKTHKLEDSEDS